MIVFGYPEEDMEQTETCFICRASDDASNLCVWFVNSQRRTVHIACWIATYQRLGSTTGEETAA